MCGFGGTRIAKSKRKIPKLKNIRFPKYWVVKVSTYSEILGQSDPVTSRKVNWTQRKTPTLAFLRYVNCFWWKTARVDSWLDIYMGVKPCFFLSDSNFSFKWFFLRETVETGNKNRGDFHCMQMSLVISMRYIFDDDCTNWRTKSRSRFGCLAVM